MAIKQIFAATSVFLTLAGCGGVPLDKQTVSVQDDQYTQNAAILGTRLFDNPSGGPFKEWFIRSYVGKSDGAVTHELYVYTHYLGEWHFYQAGADDTAGNLHFVSIDQQVGDCRGICDFNETFALVLSDAFLRARAPTGFSVKVSAKDGTAFILSIPTGQIQPQLDAVESYRTAHALSRSLSTSNKVVAPLDSGLSPPRLLGIGAVPTPSPLANMLKISGGLLVISVTPGSVADKAGLRAGDVILSYASKPIGAVVELQAAIAETPAGTSVQILAQRGNVQLPIQVKF